MQKLFININNSFVKARQKFLSFVKTSIILFSFNSPAKNIPMFIVYSKRV